MSNDQVTQTTIIAGIPLMEEMMKAIEPQMTRDQIERLVKFIMQKSMAACRKHFDYQGEGFMPNPEWHELHKELVATTENVLHG